ncbi:MAG: hypothetical protein AB1758_23175 [Candidatus Eremiobacterota bacterium]
MRTLVTLLLLVALSRSLAAEERKCSFRPDVSFVMLTTGIEGGIAPKVPPLQLMAVRKPDGSAVLYCRRYLGGESFRYTRGTAPSFAKLLEATVGVEKLPLEEPKGLDDIYGAKTSLHVHSGKCWHNQPPNGCILGHSDTRASQSDKQTFLAAVKSVEGWEGLCTSTVAESDYTKALESLFPPPG